MIAFLYVGHFLIEEGNDTMCNMHINALKLPSSSLGTHKLKSFLHAFRKLILDTVYLEVRRLGEQ